MFLGFLLGEKWIMNAIKLLSLVLAAVVLVLVAVDPALAQDHGVSFGGAAMGKGLGAGLVIIGAALGFGKIGAAALESMARQPETAGKVQTAMIIIAALLEGATFFALIICILI
jgi:F-type H+-transporting ATPase subunit c